MSSTEGINSNHSHTDPSARQDDSGLDSAPTSEIMGAVAADPRPPLVQAISSRMDGREVLVSDHDGGLLEQPSVSVTAGLDVPYGGIPHDKKSVGEKITPSNTTLSVRRSSSGASDDDAQALVATAAAQSPQQPQQPSVELAEGHEQAASAAAANGVANVREEEDADVIRNSTSTLTPHPAPSSSPNNDPAPITSPSRPSRVVVKADRNLQVPRLVRGASDSNPEYLAGTSGGRSGAFARSESTPVGSSSNSSNNTEYLSVGRHSSAYSQLDSDGGQSHLFAGGIRYEKSAHVRLGKLDDSVSCTDSPCTGTCCHPRSAYDLRREIEVKKRKNQPFGVKVRLFRREIYVSHVAIGSPAWLSGIQVCVGLCLCMCARAFGVCVCGLCLHPAQRRAR